MCSYRIARDTLAKLLAALSAVNAVSRFTCDVLLVMFIRE